MPEPGTTGQGTGLAGTGRQRQRHCPLLAGWEAGDTDPWLLLTDVPPEASPACWYGLRAWSAQGVTMTTRAGWQWQRTPRPTPDRAARLWLAVAVATLGLLRVGGEADETIPASTVPAVTALAPTSSRTRRATRLRLVRVCRRGGHRSLGALLDHAPLPLGRFVPDPWPAVPVPEEAAPSLESSHPPALKAVEEAGRTLRVQLQPVGARTAAELEGAFAAMARARAQAVLVLGAAVVLAERHHLTELAMRHRLPTMFSQKEPVEAGGLMSYGPDFADLYRRGAIYVDKILKGARPADLPVEQAMKFDLLINLKTAQALGITIPPVLLFQADEVIR